MIDVSKEKTRVESEAASLQETGLDGNYLTKADSLILHESAARRLIACVFVLTVIVQMVYMAWIGNGLNRYSDPYSEANALRAAEAYSKEGFTSHYGLPRIAYGTQFPKYGVVTESGIQVLSQTDRNNWVYTHYPPGPDIMCGVMVYILGIGNVWIFRLFPVCLGLLATATFLCTLGRAFGYGRGALIAAACFVLPMFHIFMPGLHYQGYSFLLLLFQLSLIIRWLWVPINLQPRHLIILFLLGFFQGWLSFDQFFVVSLAAIPFWLLRRAEGHDQPAYQLGWAVALPLTGFGVAHLLHFLQVANELGGVYAVFTDLSNAAAFRAGVSHHYGYMGNIAKAVLHYRRLLEPNNNNWHFGPFLILAVIVTVPLVIFHSMHIMATLKNKLRKIEYSISWQGPSGPLPALVAALLVSSMWIFAMPQHAHDHSFFVARHFFILYLCLIITIIRSLNISSWT